MCRALSLSMPVAADVHFPLSPLPSVQVEHTVYLRCRTAGTMGLIVRVSHALRCLELFIFHFISPARCELVLPVHSPAQRQVQLLLLWCACIFTGIVQDSTSQQWLGPTPVLHVHEGVLTLMYIRMYVCGLTDSMSLLFPPFLSLPSPLFPSPLSLA